MMIRKSFFGACCLFLVVSCGDDGGGGGSFGDPIPNAQAETAGTNSFNGAIDLTSLGATPGSENALGQSFAVYSALSQMSAIKQGAQGSSARVVVSQNVWDPNCVSTAGNTTTYSACDSGSAIVDGTVTGTDTRVDIDLVITTDQLVLDMTGDLTFSPTALSGTINYDSSIDANGTTINTTYNGMYNVTMDGQGCPIGGDVQVHYTVGGGANFDIWAKAEFGPACGDVTFY